MERAVLRFFEGDDGMRVFWARTASGHNRAWGCTLLNPNEDAESYTCEGRLVARSDSIADTHAPVARKNAERGAKMKNTKLVVRKIVHLVGTIILIALLAIELSRRPFLRSVFLLEKDHEILSPKTAYTGYERRGSGELQSIHL